MQQQEHNELHANGEVSDCIKHLNSASEFAQQACFTRFCEAGLHDQAFHC